MEIKQAQKLINQKVRYINAAFDIDSLYILHGILVRREGGKFTYLAELKDIKAPCSYIYDDLQKVEAII